MKKTIDIEALLSWAYMDQKVGGMLAGRLEPAEAAADGRQVKAVSGDGCYQLMRNAALGARVDGSPGAGFFEVAPDAEIVHEAIGRLPPLSAQIVRLYARTGLRPDWMPNARPQYVPRRMVLRHGKRWPKYEYDSAENGERPFFCPMRLINHPELIEQRRRIWLLWQHSLTMIAAYFQQRPDILARHVVTGPAAPPEPWAGVTREVVDERWRG